MARKAVLVFKDPLYGERGQIHFSEFLFQIACCANKTDNSSAFGCRCCHWGLKTFTVLNDPDSCWLFIPTDLSGGARGFGTGMRVAVRRQQRGPTSGSRLSRGRDLLRQPALAGTARVYATNHQPVTVNRTHRDPQGVNRHVPCVQRAGGSGGSSRCRCGAKKTRRRGLIPSAAASEIEGENDDVIGRTVVIVSSCGGVECGGAAEEGRRRADVSVIPAHPPTPCRRRSFVPPLTTGVHPHGPLPFRRRSDPVVRSQRI
ncbi:hypothetical protein F2P81_008377 [Scophthalmus maximus]|uniref:Uncharacterized protein n=1 Tax=Scophthalmus maximus TaxID=52904 RepID=A0A6A4TD52_SCOMX|nr:hypothetical protein F2P81_008377 [Scophthalmus maximus]